RSRSLRVLPGRPATFDRTEVMAAWRRPRAVTSFPVKYFTGEIRKRSEAMALLERVSTLIRANLNDLIDRAEDPEKMIKQVILDMENQYLQVKTQVAISMADHHLLQKKQKEHEDKAADWMRKAERAVDKS